LTGIGTPGWAQASLRFAQREFAHVPFDDLPKSPQVGAILPTVLAPRGRTWRYLSLGGSMSKNEHVVRDVRRRSARWWVMSRASRAVARRWPRG